MDKTFRNKIAIMLFLFSMFLAGWHTISIKNTFQEHLNEEYKLNYEIVQVKPKLNNGDSNIWHVVNICWFLFVGSLIHGKIEW